MDTKQVKEQLIAKIRLKLRVISDEELLKLIVSLDKNKLNNQIKGGTFPAWDIAYRLHSNSWSMSAKQRKGLVNVLTYYLADFIFDGLLSGERERVEETLNRIEYL